MIKIIQKFRNLKSVQKIENICFLFFQIVSIPFDYFITRAFAISIIKPDSFVVPPGTLVISNHQSKVDPFLVMYNLGFSNHVAVLPFRVPVESEYMEKAIIGKLIYCIGGFDIGKNSIVRMKKMLYIRELLKKKRMVLIFPEAKLVKNDSVEYGEFKKGIFLLLSDPNTPVLFVRISGLHKISLKNMFKGNIGMKIEYNQVVSSSDTVFKIEEMERFFMKE